MWHGDSPYSDVRSSLLQHTDVCCEAATSSGCGHYYGSKGGSQVKEQGEGQVNNNLNFIQEVSEFTDVTQVTYLF